MNTSEELVNLGLCFIVYNSYFEGVNGREKGYKLCRDLCWEGVEKPNQHSYNDQTSDHINFGLFSLLIIITVCIFYSTNTYINNSNNKTVNVTEV